MFRRFFKLPTLISGKSLEFKEFDCEIEITRMLDLLKDGWKIKISKEFQKYFEGTKMELLIGIFGDKFSGKTFLLQKILNELIITDRDLKRTDDKDEGLRSSLFFKNDEKNKIIFLDSLGSNLTSKSALFYNRIDKIDENLDPLEKEKRKRDYETTSLINELFIRNFVINISSICLFICPYLNGSALERLNRIKENLPQKVIIIHNIPALGSLKDIDIYYNEILKLELNVERFQIPNKDYYYYTSKELHDDKEIILVHVILGNDNIIEIKKYNEVIIEYLKHHIMGKPKKEFDFKEKFKDFCEQFAKQYFDLKQRTSGNVSLLVSAETINKLLKKGEILLDNDSNKVKYQVVKKQELALYNLRFKNITLDFISGKEQKKEQLKIRFFKIYYVGNSLYVEFYPLGYIEEKNIKVKIAHHSKVQQLEISGEYDKNDRRMSKNLMEQEETITDSISIYKSFILKEFISISICLLKTVAKVEKNQNGEVKVTIDIDLPNEGDIQEIDFD